MVMRAVLFILQGISVKSHGYNSDFNDKVKVMAILNPDYKNVDGNAYAYGKNMTILTVRVLTLKLANLDKGSLSRHYNGRNESNAKAEEWIKPKGFLESVLELCLKRWIKRQQIAKGLLYIVSCRRK